jgi:hypothetical protein
MIRIQDLDLFEAWIRGSGSGSTQVSWIRNNVGTSTFPVTTQVAAKLSILSFIAENVLPVPRDLEAVHPTGSQDFLIFVYKAFLFFVIAEKGPGAWDQDLSTQLAAKLLMIDSNAGQIPHPDRYNIRDWHSFTAVLWIRILMY